MLEEDDEDEKEPLTNKTAPARPARLFVPEDMRTLIKYRQARQSQPKLPKRLDPVKLRKIEHEARLMGDPLELIHEFVTLKYARLSENVLLGSGICKEFHKTYDDIKNVIISRLEAGVREGAAIAKSIEHECCKIEFRHTPAWEESILRIEKEIANMRDSFFVEILENAQTFIVDMQRLVERDYLGPRRSARANIDNLIDTSAEIVRQYQQLQEVGWNALEGSLQIRAHSLRLVRRSLGNNPDFHDCVQRLASSVNDFSFVLHAHRAAWFARQRRLHPLIAGELSAWADFKPDDPHMSSEQVIEAIALKDKIAHRQLLEKQQRITRRQIWGFYTSKWNGTHAPDSPMLDKSWRQLDVMAPLEVLTLLFWRLSNEITYLGFTLRGMYGPMWEQLPPWALHKHSEAFKRWLRVFRQQRSEFLTEVRAYRNINWIRLGIEEKLHRLGEPNFIQEENLFLAPNPLSQNHSLFRSWIDRILGINFEAWYLHKVLSINPESMQKVWEELTAKHEEEIKEEIGQPYTIPALGSVNVRSRKRHRVKHAAVTSKLPRSISTTIGRGPQDAERFFISRPVTNWKRTYSTRSALTHGEARDGYGDSLQSPSPTTVVSVIDTSKRSLRLTEDTTLPGNPASQLSKSVAKEVEPPLFWNYRSQPGPEGQKPIVHYCRTLQSTENVARHFLDSKVIGFDMEWKAGAFASDTIQNNVSLIQIANEERIALFQVALFKPACTLQDLVAPSLKRLLESADVIKVGVAIKADTTRLRKYLGIDAQSIFELSHLYKLVKYGASEPRLINKRSVNLSDQMEEHFGLPLEKGEDVRCGDWARPLSYRQVQCELYQYKRLQLFQSYHTFSKLSY